MFIFENKNLSQEDINERNRLIFRYVIRAYALKNKEKIRFMIKEMPDTFVTEGMTIYEMMIAEGMDKGLKEGIQRGAEIEKIKNQISFSLKFILFFPTLSFKQIALHAETTPDMVKKLSTVFKSGDFKKIRKTIFTYFKKMGELREEEVKAIEAIITKYMPQFKALKDGKG